MSNNYHKIFISVLLTNILNAVSYTHLDVYKRQHPAIIDNIMNKVYTYLSDTCLLYTSRCV